MWYLGVSCFHLALSVYMSNVLCFLYFIHPWNWPKTKTIKGQVTRSTYSNTGSKSIVNATSPDFKSSHNPNLLNQVCISARHLSNLGIDLKCQLSIRIGNKDQSLALIQPGGSKAHILWKNGSTINIVIAMNSVNSIKKRNPKPWFQRSLLKSVNHICPSFRWSILKWRTASNTEYTPCATKKVQINFSQAICHNSRTS